MEQHHNEMKDSDNQNPSYKEKRRSKAKEKRHKDEMSVTVFGIIIYSMVLIFVVLIAYMGFKTAITNYRTKQAILLEEEQKAKEEAERLEEEARQKAEEEAKALEEEQTNEPEVEEETGYVDAVFSVIENVSEPGNALVNTFEFARKSLDDESEKLMDYEVYTNPKTGKITKVTTRENCGDLFEITDYYYNDGVINYIAQYREDTDIPMDLSSDKIESRFYYSKDKMVKYIYCENGKATEYSTKDFGLYSSGTIEQYEYMENMMLESSKTVFEKAGSLDEKIVISGYVLDELNCPPSDPASIKLLDKNGRVVDETTSNGDGYYAFVVSADDSKEYIIDVTGREDTIESKVYGIKAKKGSKAVDVDTVYLAYSVYDTVYPVQIFVKDADDSNKAISGADIKIRYGINNRDGEVCLSGVLGDAGETMPALRSGNYTAEISKSGYETCYVSFTVKADCSALVAFAVKDVAEGTYKCVLSYETTPLDLDLRVYDTYGRNVIKSKNDSVGVITAETITLNDSDSGTYTFYVSDYTDIVGCDMMTYRLSQSGAKIFVYSSEGLEEIYPVPAAHAGIVWRPFEIRNHKINTINDYYAYIVDNSEFRNK